MAKQTVAPFLREQKPSKKIVRYRAHYGPLVVSDETSHFQSPLFRTGKAALDDLIEGMIENGIIRVEEVPVKRKQRTTYEEVEGDD